MVKHKPKYSCASAIYFSLDPDIINENYKFTYCCNNTGITPTVLGRGNEIILANWPHDKHITCNVNRLIEGTNFTKQNYL